MKPTTLLHRPTIDSRSDVRARRWQLQRPRIDFGFQFIEKDSPERCRCADRGLQTRLRAFRALAEEFESERNGHALCDGVVFSVIAISAVCPLIAAIAATFNLLSV